MTVLLAKSKGFTKQGITYLEASAKGLAEPKTHTGHEYLTKIHCFICIKNVLDKGGLFLESFFFCSIPPKKVPNHPPELCISRDDYQESVWYFFGKIGAYLKNFLKLSHLYITMVKWGAYK